MLKRYDVEIETSQGYGMYSGDEYHDLVCRKSKSGEWVKAKEAAMLKAKLESEANITFSKVDTFRWVSYSDGSAVVFARTLGECVTNTAKELGE